MRLFTLLPVKHSFTMSNILIDRNALKDLIKEDKGKKIGQADAGLHKSVLELMKDDHLSVIRRFFDVECFETRTKKYVHCLTDGKSVSVVLAEVADTDSQSKPKTSKSKKKRKRDEEEEDPMPTTLLPAYQVTVGLDPGLRYLFVAKNDGNDQEKKECNDDSNSNVEDQKKKYERMSSKEYYHKTKFNWKRIKQEKCYDKNPLWDKLKKGYISEKEWEEPWEAIYKEYPWWKEEMKKGVMTPKTHVLDELKKYTVFALRHLDMALDLHFKNPFRNWKFKTYVYKQKTFEKILRQITKKSKQAEEKKVIVGFGNWGNPRDSIIRGHRRGPVEQVKEKLKKWCEVVDVDEFRTSKLCCHCHYEMAKGQV